MLDIQLNFVFHQIEFNFIRCIFHKLKSFWRKWDKSKWIFVYLISFVKEIFSIVRMDVNKKIKYRNWKSIYWLDRIEPRTGFVIFSNNFIKWKIAIKCPTKKIKIQSVLRTWFVVWWPLVLHSAHFQVQFLSSSFQQSFPVPKKKKKKKVVIGFIMVSHTNSNDCRVSKWF